jgi:phosphotransferase system HPr-like phosphotransfer protein
VSLGAFGMSPVERHLLYHGGVGAPVPRDAQSITLTVRDPEGIDCEGAKYLFLAWRALDCDLWVTHPKAGSVHLVEAGSATQATKTLKARFKQGEELVFTATGEDAELALYVCRRMLEAAPEDRGGIFRRWQRRGMGGL